LANELARELADLLGDAALAEILDRVDAEAATPEDVAALRGWPAANREQVLARVRDELPPLPSLRDELAALAIPRDGWRPRVMLGPATVGVECPAATVRLPGETIVLGLLPPADGTLALDAGPLAAAGRLFTRPGGASGSLGVRLGPTEILGFADLEVADGVPSLVVVLGIHFAPPVQLSFGFALSAVGGVVGVNRRIETDALRARLADGTALDALFPRDPVQGASGALVALGAIFRREPGRHVVGPTFALSWLDVGAISIVRLDLGLVLQLPDAKIVLAGRGRVQLPPVLDLRVDAVGELDPGRKLAAIDAVLVDSRALGIFRVTGTAALRTAWGDPAYVVFALGGFYPGFKPEPASIPPQQRLGLALDVPAPLTFRASGYLAITSNSFQAGVDVEVGIDLDVISARGFLRFDAIVEFDPFHVHADYAAGWEVDVAGIFEGGTTVSGWIDGPGPWTIHARVSISLLIDDFTWSDTFRIGAAGPPRDPPVPHLVDVLRPTLGAPSNIRASDAVDPHVSVQPRPADLQGKALCSPLAALTWTQDVVPLDLDVTRAAGRPLASEQTLSVEVGGTVARPATPPGALDWFAPGSFRSFTAAEAMNLPPFQLLRSGTRLELATARGSSASKPFTYKAFFRRPADWREGNLPLVVLLPAFLQTMVAGHGAAPIVEDRSPVVHVSEERWAVTERDGTWEAASAVHAFVGAQSAGGVPHALAEAPLTVKAI